MARRVNVAELRRSERRAAEKRPQQSQRSLRLLLGHEMTGLDLAARDLGRKGLAPDVERRFGAARQIKLAPDEKGGAGDGAVESKVGLVLLHVHGGAGAVVLAKGVDA